mmetsp:Transcript_55118/g.130419  ORF Transcript_55118/g.130419 Transcript_55118/m.130419 type:complete len:523 (+) Transcript_55118:83-1651(+)
MKVSRQLPGCLAAMRAPKPLLGALMERAQRSPFSRADARALSSPSNEGIGAPFLHAFAKASPGAPPAAVHVRQDGACYVIDQDGNRLLDGLAGLWSVSLGYDQPRLVEAAAKQMRTLPYYHSFWNQGHDAGYKLAEELREFIPLPITKVAFTGGGSDANDTAVKLVWYYNNALGRAEKKKVIARTKAYHGVTALAASCSGLASLHSGFGSSTAPNAPLAGFIHVSCPHMYRTALPGEGEEAFAARLAQELDETIQREGPDTVGALIAEPLMGAGGVMPPPKGYFQLVQKVCAKHDVLIISDEVVCGFGRLGSRFGFEAYGFTPDIITMAKGLTSSYAPMGALAMTDKVSSVIADGSSGSLLGHGYTYGAHPVSCAVASECLAIFRDDKVLENVRAQSPALQEGLVRVCQDSPIVGEVRGRGLIAAVELVGDRETRTPFPAAAAVGTFFCSAARRHGVIVRAIGDVVAVSPPLVIKSHEIAEIVEGYRLALQETEAMVRSKGLLSATASTATPLFTESLQPLP